MKSRKMKESESCQGFPHFVLPTEGKSLFFVDSSSTSTDSSIAPSFIKFFDRPFPLRSVSQLAGPKPTAHADWSLVLLPRGHLDRLQQHTASRQPLTCFLSSQFACYATRFFRQVTWSGEMSFDQGQSAPITCSLTR